MLAISDIDSVDCDYESTIWVKKGLVIEQHYIVI